MFIFACLFFAIILLTGFNIHKNKKNVFSPPDLKDTIYDTVIVYEVVYVYDTIYTKEIITDTVKIYDSLHTNKNIRKKEISISSGVHDILEIEQHEIIYPKFNSKISMELMYSPIYTNSFFSAGDIYSKALEYNKQSLTPLIGFSTGININYNNKKSILSSGIAFSQIKEQFNYTATGNKTEVEYYYKYFTNSITEIDTIWFINIDTLLLTGDTIYEAFQDTNYVYHLDSLYTFRLDTIEFNYSDKNTNKYSYIEFPFIFGYKIDKSKFNIIPEIGLILGIIMNYKGKVISLENLKQTNNINDETKLSPVLLSLYTGVRLDYFLTKRIDFFTKAFYRQDINSVFQNYPIIMRRRIFGIQFGFRYKFQKNYEK